MLRCKEFCQTLMKIISRSNSLSIVSCWRTRCPPTWLKLDQKPRGEVEWSTSSWCIRAKGTRAGVLYDPASPAWVYSNQKSRGWSQARSSSSYLGVLETQFQRAELDKMRLLLLGAGHDLFPSTSNQMLGVESDDVAPPTVCM